MNSEITQAIAQVEQDIREGQNAADTLKASIKSTHPQGVNPAAKKVALQILDSQIAKLTARRVMLTVALRNKF